MMTTCASPGASHVAVLKDKRIIAMGEPNTMATGSAMKTVYNGDVMILQMVSITNNLCTPFVGDLMTYKTKI